MNIELNTANNNTIIKLVEIPNAGESAEMNTTIRITCMT